MSQNITSDYLINMAQLELASGNDEKAFSLFFKVASDTNNIDAKYNLGTLYAMGRGTQKDYLEASYWFHQANLLGDEQAGRMRTKCLMDYIHENFNQKSAYDVYLQMIQYAKRLYPEYDMDLVINKNIPGLADFHFNKKEYAMAAKLYRVTAEYTNDGYSQNILAVLYNAGAGVERNDLVALYWFDRASDNSIEEAKQDRNGIFKAYMQNLGKKRLAKELEIIVQCCTNGSNDIPKDPQKINYWKTIINNLNQ